MAITKAEEAYRKHLLEGWTPTSREFDAYFKVGDQQGRNLRRQIKTLAADDGHVYGYHPGFNTVMLAPSGNVNDTRAIIDYAAKQAGRAIGGLTDQIRGAKGDKVVTAGSANKVSRAVKDAGHEIEQAVNALSWKKAP